MSIHAVNSKGSSVIDLSLTELPETQIQSFSTIEGTDRHDHRSKMRIIHLAAQMVLRNFTYLQVFQIEPHILEDQELNFSVKTALSLIFCEEDQQVECGLVEQILINTSKELSRNQKEAFCLILLQKLKERMDKTDKSLITKAAYSGNLSNQDWYKIFYDFYVFSEVKNPKVSKSIEKMLSSLTDLENDPSLLSREVLLISRSVLKKIQEFHRRIAT